jgi:hypothetical protein
MENSALFSRSICRSISILKSNSTNIMEVNLGIPKKDMFFDIRPVSALYRLWCGLINGIYC